MKNKGESSGQPDPKKGEFGPKIRSRLFFFFENPGDRRRYMYRGQGTAIGPAAYTVVEHFKERDGFHGNSG
jgi:hypothetical protein